jgi:hypothetical protein
MSANDNQEVSYGEFVRHLDWVDHLVTSVPVEGDRPISIQRDVDFSAMLNDMFGSN